MKSYVYFLLTALCVFCTGSCNHSKSDSSTGLTYAETITSKDSVEISNLIHQYFEHQIQGNHYDAAAMLYRHNSENPNYTPELLDNDQIEQIVNSMKFVPVVSYSIEYMKFVNSLHNEVMTKIVMHKGENGLPDVTSKVVFKPIRHLGQWYLTVLDSNSGDRQLATPEERKANMLQKQH